MDHDADHDADHDTGEVTHAADVSLEHDVHPDVEHGHETEHGQDGQSETTSLFWKIALLLGIGKVPLSIIIMTMCFVWGFVGYMLTSALRPILRTPFLFFPPVFLATLVITIFATGYVAKVVALIMPKTSTFTTTTKDLIGKVGESLFSIDQNNGTIRIKDQFGNLQQYAAYSEKPIPGNTQVLLVSWDEQRNAFLVTILRPELAKSKEEEEKLKGGKNG
jgi:membrane protein implicated in regulation of membrane protease activity